MVAAPMSTRADILDRIRDAIGPDRRDRVADYAVAGLLLGTSFALISALLVHAIRQRVTPDGRGPTAPR